MAVAKAGYQQGQDFAVAGIDSAAIDPARYAIRHGELLQTIQFHGNTRMEELPFPDGMFDAVISQYGIEYGELQKARNRQGAYEQIVKDAKSGEDGPDTYEWDEGVAP